MNNQHMNAYCHKQEKELVLTSNEQSKLTAIHIKQLIYAIKSNFGIKPFPYQCQS
jgi:hypothetical protein